MSIQFAVFARSHRYARFLVNFAQPGTPDQDWIYLASGGDFSRLLGRRGLPVFAFIDEDWVLDPADMERLRWADACGNIRLTFSHPDKFPKDLTRCLT